MNSPLYYIASPIKHTDESVERQRMISAARFAARFHDLGIPVFCPAAHARGYLKYTSVRRHWDYWQQIDLPILYTCDALIVLRLDGWDISEGVSHEIAEAKQFIKPVHYFTPGQSLEEFVDCLTLDWIIGE